MHTSQCHHCHECHYYTYYFNLDFLLFYNVTCYTNFLFSHIHANIAYLFHVMCTFGCHRHDIREDRVYLFPKNCAELMNFRALVALVIQLGHRYLNLHNII